MCSDSPTSNSTLKTPQISSRILDFRTSVLIVAAGASTRFGRGKKELLVLDGISVLERAIKPFLSLPALAQVVLVSPQGGEEALIAALSQKMRNTLDTTFGSWFAVVPGGATRQESVLKGLAAIARSFNAIDGHECAGMVDAGSSIKNDMHMAISADAVDSVMGKAPAPKSAASGAHCIDFVLIHDGARPWASSALALRVLEGAHAQGACIPLLPVADTPKIVSPNGMIATHLERSTVRAAQTPQAFRLDGILKAHLAAAADSFECTDDAGLWARYCSPVFSVEGEANNRKITTEADIPGAFRANASTDLGEDARARQRAGLPEKPSVAATLPTRSAKADARAGLPEKPPAAATLPTRSAKADARAGLPEKPSVAATRPTRSAKADARAGLPEKPSPAASAESTSIVAGRLAAGSSEAGSKAADSNATYDPLNGLRIGQGFDIHELVPGRPLMLGGYHIPSPVGERAHSDGDVLLHAIIDAMLGACCLGDIGSHFPPSDARWKNAASEMLCAKTLELVRDYGARLVSLDCTVKLEKPTLKTYIADIRSSIARILSMSEDRVSVKAKTSEGMGPVGEGRAVEAEALAVLHWHKPDSV